MKEKEALENVLTKFFQMLKVGKDQNIPKRNTCESYKSFIKLFIQKETKLDISNAVEFPKFNSFYRGFMKTLKDNGRADTSHHPEIPSHIIQKIYSLLAILHQLIVKSSSDEQYQSLLDQVPDSYKGKHHYLVQYGK